MDKEHELMNQNLDLNFKKILNQIFKIEWKTMLNIKKIKFFLIFRK